MNNWIKDAGCWMQAGDGVGGGKMVKMDWAI